MVSYFIRCMQKYVSSGGFNAIFKYIFFNYSLLTKITYIILSLEHKGENAIEMSDNVEHHYML